MVTSSKFEWLKGKPKWFVILVIVAAAIIAVSNLFTSCSTIRVVGNSGSTTATVRQSALDSMQIKLEFNPIGRQDNTNN